MRVVLLVMLLGAIVQGADKCPGYEPGDRQIPKVRKTYPTHIPQIVRIKTDCGGCTGWIIERSTIVTAAHCFNEAYTHITAKFVDGSTSPMTLAKLGNYLFDASEDWAILKGDTHGIPALATIEENSGVAFACAAVGYGMEHTQKSVPCYGGISVKSDLLTFAGAVDFGDSGGPVINGDGMATAEIVSINADDSPIFFAVPIAKILKGLKELQNVH